MDRKKGILLVSLAASFLVALICVAAVFFPQNAGGGTSGYFVEFALSDEFYVDGEPLSRSERSALLDEIGSLLNGIEDEISVEKSGSDLSRINAAQAGAEISVGDIPLAEIDREAKITGLPVAEQAM